MGMGGVLAQIETIADGVLTYLPNTHIYISLPPALRLLTQHKKM